jgi:(p)ppGpp synthase/HD superfamily hydrolase
MLLGTATSQLHFSFSEHLPMTQRALSFASSRHRGQHRDADGATFLVHPAEVASLLARLGYADHVVAAAVLHDVLEDTDTERGDLESRFGRQVADLVASVSDDPRIPDEDRRKESVREHVSGAGDEALAVFAADKVSKVRELRLLLATGLPAQEAQIKFERYRAALDMLDAHLSDKHLLALLRFEVEALTQLPPRLGCTGTTATDR